MEVLLNVMWLILRFKQRLLGISTVFIWAENPYRKRSQQSVYHRACLSSSYTWQQLRTYERFAVVVGTFTTTFAWNKLPLKVGVDRLRYLWWFLLTVRLGCVTHFLPFVLPMGISEDHSLLWVHVQPLKLRSITAKLFWLRDVTPVIKLEKNIKRNRYQLDKLIYQTTLYCSVLYCVFLCEDLSFLALVLGRPQPHLALVTMVSAPFLWAGSLFYFIQLCWVYFLIWFLFIYFVCVCVF